MVCWHGNEFPLASLRPLLSDFVVCTEREISCDAECAVTSALGGLTVIIALFDAYTVAKYLKHFTASARHLWVMLLALAAYALMNTMIAVLQEEAFMWAGIMGFLRIYFVYHYMLHMLSVLFIEGYGDYEELIEKVGVLAAEKGKSEAWVRGCVFKVQIWMAEVMLSYLVKRVCDTYLVFVTLDGARVSIWQGAFIYITFVDIAFVIVCAKGISDLCKLAEPLMAPSSRWIVKRRHVLFNIFYLLISLVYPSIVTLVFTANVGVDDETYGWWREHSPIIIAAHLLPFQWAFHKYWIPMYSWSFSRKPLASFVKDVTCRKDLHAKLQKMAEQGVFLTTLHEEQFKDLPQPSTPLREKSAVSTAV